MTTIEAYSNPMEKCEVRKNQWEIGESLFSCLKGRGMLSGPVGVIIRECGTTSSGNAVAKYLQRAEAMQNNPFRVIRKKSAANGCTYRITLKQPVA